MTYAPEIDSSALPEGEREKADYITNNLEEMERFVGEFRHSLELYAFSEQQEALLEDVPRPPLPPSPEWLLDPSDHQAFLAQSAAHDAAMAEYWQHVEAANARKEELNLVRLRLRAWGAMGTRNGAIVLYGFWMASQNVDSLLAECSTLEGKIDDEARSAAAKIFKDQFPTVAGVRNSAAHPGEFSGTPKQFAKHAATSDQGHPAFNMEEGAAKLFISGMIYGDKHGRKHYTATFKGKIVSYELSQESIDRLKASAMAYCKAFYPAESSGSAWRCGRQLENERQRQED